MALLSSIGESALPALSITPSTDFEQNGQILFFINLHICIYDMVYVISAYSFLLLDIAQKIPETVYLG